MTGGQPSPCGTSPVPCSGARAADGQQELAATALRLPHGREPPRGPGSVSLVAPVPVPGAFFGYSAR